MGRVAESDLVVVAGAAVWGIKDQTKKKAERRQHKRL
jgi:hypothetical protein